MKQYQQLTITIPKGKQQEYLSALYEAVATSTWKQRKDMEDDISKNNELDAVYLCFETPQKKRNIKEALVWLYLDKRVGSIRLANIVPLNVMELTIEQYNHIVNLFHIDILSKIGIAKVNISSAYFMLQEEMGEQCARSLQNFSNVADRRLGYVKPLDFDLWAHFIYQAYENGSQIDLKKLQQWFVDEGWSARMAQKLTRSYDYSMDLLKYGCKNK